MALILATWFGSGMAPMAPGTFGTLAAVPLVFFNCLGKGWSAAVLVVITLTAVWSAHQAEKLLGRKDPSAVVIDEAAGLLSTLFLAPVTWQNVVLGCILFRFFDIVKPWPARQTERLHGGIGIVTDDLVAGIYANMALRGVLWLLD